MMRVSVNGQIQVAAGLFSLPPRMSIVLRSLKAGCAHLDLVLKNEERSF
jgi:hypothetical protein